MSVKQRRLDNNSSKRSEPDYRSEDRVRFHAEEDMGWMSAATPLLRSVDLEIGRGDYRRNPQTRTQLRDIDFARGRERRNHNLMVNIMMGIMIISVLSLIIAAFTFGFVRTTDFQRIVTANDYSRMTLIDQGVVTVTPAGTSLSVLVDNRTSDIGSHTVYIKDSNGKINEHSLVSGKSYKIYQILDWYYVEETTPAVVVPLEIIAR